VTSSGLLNIDPPGVDGQHGRSYERGIAPG
jgi:hypothetical protein